MLFVVSFRSESGDDYMVKFTADKQPETDDEWLEVIKAELPHEYDIAEFGDGPNYPESKFDGPGIGGTFLHLQDVMQVA